MFKQPERGNDSLMGIQNVGVELQITRKFEIMLEKENEETAHQNVQGAWGKVGHLTKDQIKNSKVKESKHVGQ